MKVMLLAAGKGTRMRPFTDVCPKPMLPILDKPIIEWIMLGLKNQGLDDFVMNLSYLPDQIVNHLGDGSRLGVNVEYSWEGKRLPSGEWEGTAIGSAGAMLKIQKEQHAFNDTFVVMCADALTDLEIAPLIAYHKAHGGLATIVSKQVPMSEVHKYGVIQAEASGRIVQFQEKPQASEALSNLISTGIYVFEPEVLQFIPENALTEGYDIGSQLFYHLLEKNQPFYHYEQDIEWMDFGHVADFWSVNASALTREIKTLELLYNAGLASTQCLNDGVFKGEQVDIPATTQIVAPVFIGHHVHLSDVQRIERGWIGPADVEVNAPEVVDMILFKQLQLSTT